jgi:pyruvate ferredoxin oxidoreductase alpha subunit
VTTGGKIIDKGTGMEGTSVGLSGGHAVAEAMRQTEPDVVACYPITPSTIIVEKFDEYVASGAVQTEFVAVESEHSAMSACVGASAAGARAQTVSSSQGLAYMWEVLYSAAGFRLPIVLHCANRTLSSPLNIHCDHSDTMGARDSGFIQLYGENAQEVYDNALMSVRIAEHPDVLLPVLHSQDGYTVTHSVERVDLLPDAAVWEFQGTYKPKVSLLDLDNPVSYGALISPEYGPDVKLAVVEAMHRARDVIFSVGREFGELSGRYRGLTEPYRMDDADLAIVLLGSTAGTARVVVDSLREQGVKAGALKIRCYRPFPDQEVATALDGKSAVAILDRALSPGSGANPLFQDVCVAMYAHGIHVPLVNYAFGLGGRDTYPGQLSRVFQELQTIAETGKTTPMVRYL